MVDIQAALPWSRPESLTVPVSNLGRLVLATRRNRLLVMGLLGLGGVLIFGGLAGSVRALTGSAPDWGVAFGGAVFLALVGAAIVVVVWARSREVFAVFEKGVAYGSGRDLRTLTWAEVEGVYARCTDVTNVASGDRRALDEYRLASGRRTVARLDWEYERHRDVGLALCAALGTHRLHDYMGAVAAGREVRFGPLRCSSHYVATANEAIPLTDVCAVRREYAHLKQAPMLVIQSSRGHLRVQEHEVPDVHGMSLLLWNLGVHHIDTSVANLDEPVG